MARPGGPDTLTPAQRDAFFRALRTPACALELAASHADVEPRTVYRWLARGKAKAHGRALVDEPYRQFRQAVLKTMREAELASLALIASAARDRAKHKGDWKAAQYLLEVRNRKRYGTRTHITHAGDENAPVVFELDTGGKPLGKDDAEPKSLKES